MTMRRTYCRPVGGLGDGGDAGRELLLLVGVRDEGEQELGAVEGKCRYSACREMPTASVKLPGQDKLPGGRERTLVPSVGASGSRMVIPRSAMLAVPGAPDLCSRRRSALAGRTGAGSRAR